jgi:hypothetical protein
MKTKLLKKIRSRFTVIPDDKEFKVIDHTEKSVFEARDINEIVRRACSRLGYDTLAYSLGTDKKRYKGRNMIAYIKAMRVLEAKKKQQAYIKLFDKK